MKSALVACGAAGLCAALSAAPVPVALTFDDGLKAQLTIAEPLIAAHGWKATFNIVTDAAGLGGQNISWDEVRELHRRGHEIASHSVSHPNLLKLLAAGDTNEVRRQIAASRDKIKREVGVAPRWLCTPYIQHNAAVERISRRVDNSPDKTRARLDIELSARVVDDAAGAYPLYICIRDEQNVAFVEPDDLRFYIRCHIL